MSENVSEASSRFPIELKVKSMSLAAEARIIRKLEKKFTKRRVRNGDFWEFPPTDERAIPTVNALVHHRKVVVREEARRTLLAYGFIRGRAYEIMENNSVTPVNWKQVEKMVAKHAPDTLPLFAEWAASAERFIANNRAAQTPVAV